MADLESEPSFLFIGNVDKEAAVGKLKNSGIYYKKKMLESNPENWFRINEIMQDPSLVGVLIKLTAQTCDSLVNEAYEEPAKLILGSLQRLPHAVLIHEGVFKDEDDQRGSSVEDEAPSLEWEEDLSFWFDKSVFRSVDAVVRERIRGLAQQYGLNILLYKTNAELSMLAATFIEQHDKKLLFRIYVPSGRLWAAEASKLLQLFRGWLAQVKGVRIRLGGYTTSKGEVHEFYGEALGGEGLSDELKEFSDFLDLCVHNPESAEQILRDNSVERASAAGIISRYAREARRLNRDIRQERELRILAVRHRLEAELEDYGLDVDYSRIAEQMIPAPTRPMVALSTEAFNSIDAAVAPRITVNQQFFNTVHGIVAQEVSGNVTLGADASKLLELVSQYGGDNSAVLESAIHEVEDPDAEQEDRLTAAQRLKGFLFTVGDKLSEATISVLQKYIESKIGF